MRDVDVGERERERERETWSESERLGEERLWRERGKGKHMNRFKV
jgi:hypothetical protein